MKSTTNKQLYMWITGDQDQYLKDEEYKTNKTRSSIIRDLIDKAKK